MLDGKTRIAPVDAETCPDDLRETLEEQRELCGAPFLRAPPGVLLRREDHAGRPSRRRQARARYAQGTHQPSRRLVERLRVLPGRPCAKSSRLGVSTEKIKALDDYARHLLFSDAEKAALEYADAITDTHRDVEDALFARLRRYYDDDIIAELTMIIAGQNASSRFNRAFRIPSQQFWKRRPERR